MVQVQKKIALLHRYPKDQIKQTNAAFPYLSERMDVLTFKKFDRLSSFKKFWKSLAWIFYAPCLVAGKGYDVLYLDDSYPFYGALVKMVSPRSKVVLRIGDLHLMYYYSGWVYKVLHFIEKISWIMADEIIAISDAMADKIEQEIGRRPKVVLDPVDPADFEPGGPCERNLVMFHGVLTKNKNVDILLSAARYLDWADFVILGDGPDFARLKSIAPKNVFFYGWVPFHKVQEHIRNCTIGVALRGDNSGNEYVVTSPFLQYGIMGKPCLVTRRKVFDGYEWQFQGFRELIEKITKILSMPSEDYKQESDKIRLHILQNHDARKIAGEIFEILNAF